MDNAIDKRHKLDDEPFDYQPTKDGRVIIYWQHKQVKVLAGIDAKKFLGTVDALDELGIQLALAKVTGNFKRGNERPPR